MKLKDSGRTERALLGILSMLNFFNLKYGPEKIDTMLFLEEIGNYSLNPSGKVREEALKFLIIAAKWKENTESVLSIASGVLQPPQLKLLQKMLAEFEKGKEIKSEEFLEDSDDDAWYNQEGSKIDRYDVLDEKFKEQIGAFTYNQNYLTNVTQIYRWVDKVSRMDDIIFDLVSNKVTMEELPYIKRIAEHMLCSYNLNV